MKLKVLLDIDDTALITRDRGKTWKEHPRLMELISKHDVILFSGNPDIKDFHEKWKTIGYISKMNINCPKADVLVDNNFDLHKSEVIVQKFYKSIDSFFRYNK
jgi:hypothetical protein